MRHRNTLSLNCALVWTLTPLMATIVMAQPSSAPETADHLQSIPHLQTLPPDSPVTFQPIAESRQQASAWLGVELGPVPAALEAHLDLQDKGVMIRNLIVDSPADQAGLQRYDVIVEADGRPVGPRIEEFISHIGDKPPGSELSLTFHRQARPHDVTVRLAEYPRNWEALKKKYEDDPDVLRRDVLGLRGRILRPGPHGWEFEELERIPELRDLDRWLERNPAEPQEEPMVDEARRVEKGQVLHVRRLEDGRYEVRRYPEGGDPESSDREQTESEVYANLDELREADEQAYDLITQDNRRLEDREPSRRYRDALDEYIRNWYREYHHQLPRSVPLPRRLPPSPWWEDESDWRRWDVPDDRRERDRREHEPYPHPQHPEQEPREHQEHRPATEFEVHADGSIGVEFWSGEDRMRITFESAAAMEQQAPRLFERYRDLIEQTR